jgi:putative phage-type endonuclease
MEYDYSVDDLLWEYYQTFGNAVDTTNTDMLASLIQKQSKMASAWRKEEVVARINRIRIYRFQLRKLQEIPLIAQRTPEWYDLRKNRLTASDTAQAMGVGKFGSKEQLVQKKATGESGGFNIFTPPLKWGTMFEAMATRCYSQRHGDIMIHEFGLIPHPNLHCYGASPDGITELGIMIEIKCPYRRKITGEVPSYYELQMQGQLSVCELYECDFIECDMQEFTDQEGYELSIDAAEVKDHGVIAEFRDHGNTMIHYEYSDPYLTPRQAFQSMQKRTAKYLKEHPDMYLFRFRPWQLRFMSVRRIMYDSSRWDNMIAPAIQSFWKDVLNRRENPKDVSSPSKRDLDLRSPKKKEVYEFIDDDE